MVLARAVVEDLSVVLDRPEVVTEDADVVPRSAGGTYVKFLRAAMEYPSLAAGWLYW